MSVLKGLVLCALFYQRYIKVNKMVEKLYLNYWKSAPTYLKTVSQCYQEKALVSEPILVTLPDDIVIYHGLVFDSDENYTPITSIKVDDEREKLKITIPIDKAATYKIIYAKYRTFTESGTSEC